MSSNYPEGVHDSDPYFDMPNAHNEDEMGRVLCDTCGVAWIHPDEPGTCLDCRNSDDAYIPCSSCGKVTTWDSTYGDLCFRCIRADNE